MEGSKPERRKKYESKSIKLGRALARLKLTANAMTALAVITAIVAGYLIYIKELILGIVLFALAIVFDVFDGAIARATNTASKYGTLLDHTVDRIVEFILIFSLAAGGYLQRRIAMLCYFGMILPSYVRARGESLFDVSAMSRGLMERKEKMTVLFSGILLYLLNIPYPLEFLDRINLAALIVAIGSFITALQRLTYFRRYNE